LVILNHSEILLRCVDTPRPSSRNAISVKEQNTDDLAKIKNFVIIRIEKDKQF